MSIQINEVPTLEANLLPVHIKYTGPANTKDYFTPTKAYDEVANTTSAYFRGCKLVGNEVKLPENSTAYIMNKHETMESAPETPQGYRTVNNYVPEAQFKLFKVYGQDTPIPLNSQWFLMSEWNDISDIIHE